MFLDNIFKFSNRYWNNSLFFVILKYNYFIDKVAITYYELFVIKISNITAIFIFNYFKKEDVIGISVFF